MSLLRSLGRAFGRPSDIVPYLGYRLNRLRVRRVTVDGEPFLRYRGALYPEYLTTGNACAFIQDVALRHCSGTGLDIGASQWPLPGSIPVRDEPEQNAYRLDAFADGSLDYVFSSHCLEHLDRWQEALSLWVRKTRPGGTLFLYLPHESNLLWQPWGPLVADGHKWMPTHGVVVPFLEANGMRVTEVNRDRDDYWSWHLVARRVSQARQGDGSG